MALTRQMEALLPTCPLNSLRRSPWGLSGNGDCRQPTWELMQWGSVERHLWWWEVAMGRRHFSFPLPTLTRAPLLCYIHVNYVKYCSLKEVF